jgi:hypothetical protein
MIRFFKVRLSTGDAFRGASGGGGCSDCQSVQIFLKYPAENSEERHFSLRLSELSVEYHRNSGYGPVKK